MKKKKVPRAVQAQQAAPRVNPFELKGAKRKFDVLGKRDKGEKKNVIKSREEAVNRRKKTLLVEYKQLRKANTFIDRRFGEDDPQLDEADKALARFQVQRLQEARRGAKFSSAAAAGGKQRSGGGREHTLTHGGISLEELEELNSRPAAALADLDDDVLEELVSAYHFGGGAAAAAGGGGGGGAGAEEGDGQQGRTRTKKEIMEEVIAKSKAAKAQKAAQREADEAALEQLDDTFRSLLGEGGGLGGFIKPPGFDKGRKVKADNDADADYDRAARELAFEAKGQATDAALSKEQLEEREAARLAALEAARLKRMRADATAAAAGGGDAEFDADEEGEDAGAGAEGGGLLPKGGYAAKRARARLEAEREERRQRRKLDMTGDALGENYALSDGDGAESDSEGADSQGEEGAAASAAANALEARRQAAAAGSHPLQQAFREAAARLAAKHGVEVPVTQRGEGDSDSEDEGETDSEDEGEEDEEGEEGSISDDAAEEGGEEEGEAVGGSRKRAKAAAAAGGEGEEEEQGTAGSSGSEEGESGEEGSDSEQQEGEQQEEEAAPHPTKALKRQQQAAAGSKPAAAAAAAAELEGPLDLSFTPAVPESYQEFAALVGGRPAEQLGLAVQRIRTFNAAALATDSKRKLQVFYGILVQHFAMLAGQQPVPSQHLDVLTQVLLQLTPEVPFYAATVARTRLDKLHERLAAALADPLGPSGGPLLGWPAPRALLQLRLFALLFPVSDRRHPVTTPLALLTGKYLSQCPVNCPYQAAVGLLLAGLALHNASEAARFCPEVVNFVTATLRAYLPAAVYREQQQPAAAAAAVRGKQAQQRQRTAAAAAAAGFNCVSRFTPGLLLLDSCKAAAAAAGDIGSSGKRSKKQQQQQQQEQEIPSIKLYQLLSAAPDEQHFCCDAFKLQVLGCAVNTAFRALTLVSRGCGSAGPEVLAPLASAAAAVAALPGLPASAAAAVGGLAKEVSSSIQQVVGSRQPLVQSHRVKVVLPREYNPRFEDDFNAAADYDFDRSRAEARKLQRAMVKEKRGAMRELRRDAAFMAAERDAEKARVDAERLASERSFYSELQRQEADAKSGGQHGMNPHKKKRK